MTVAREHHRAGHLRRLAGITAVHALLLMLVALALAPLAYLVIGAFKTQESFFTSMFLPRGDGPLGIDIGSLTLNNFARMFSDLSAGRALANSVFLSSATALLATIVASAGGYALAMFRFPGRRIVEVIVLSAMLVPPTLLLAPGYEWLYRLGLLDTFTGLILPASAPAFGVLLFRQAVTQSVPRELVEAARIDGCGEINIFFVHALPLVRPMIGAFLMITFLGMWNNFIGPQVVLASTERFPIAVRIAQLTGPYGEDFGLLMAGALLSIAPVVLLFLFLQREFLQGLTSGAVKG